MKRFIAVLALSPWAAYYLLGFVAGQEEARAFVGASLWFATPVLVLAAALRAYDEGVQRGRNGPHGTSSSLDSTDHLALQTTELGQSN